MGRPPKLNNLISDELLKMVEAGIPETTAAKAVGIAPSTFEVWKAKGKQGSEPYKSFLESLTRARGRAEASLVATVIRASKNPSDGDWRAASWLLQHAGDWRQRWGQVEAVRSAVDAALSQVVSVIEKQIEDPEQRHKLLTALVAAGVGNIRGEDDAEA